MMRSAWLALSLLPPAGCISSCVAATMLVRTRRGEIAAGSVVVGDRVESVDVARGVVVEGEVVHVRKAVRECVALRWRGGELVCTPEHPLYSPERGDYRPASDWITGGLCNLLVRTGESVEEVVVVEVEKFAGVREVVDLSLAAEPRNFVAAGVVVHNKSPPPPEVAEAPGPTFTLTATDRSRAFLLKICAGDQAVRVDGHLDVFMHASLTPEPSSSMFKPRLTLRIAEIEEAALYPLVNSTLGLEIDAMKLPDSTCSPGLDFRFERDDDAPDGAITVDWDAALVFMEDPSQDPRLTIEPR